MKKNKKYKQHIIILLLFISNTMINAQRNLEQINHQLDLNPINFPSPNASTLGLYGTIPVSHFTGIPNINIPLYTINDGSIEVPLNLSYHLAAIKPDAHPGWTGLGWSLISGGSITREVKGMLDEFKTKNDQNNGQDRGFYFLRGDHNERNHDLDTDAWDTKRFLTAYAQNTSLPNQRQGFNRDVMSDNFNFNFLGYSGTFFLNEKLEWVVKSDHNIKVVFNKSNGGLVSQNQLRDPLTRNNSSFDNDNFFNKFTLITDDGTKYTFGGVNATEYSLVYGLDVRKTSSKINPTTWNLVEIEKPNGDKVEFEYEARLGDKNEIICTRFTSFSHNNYSTLDCSQFSFKKELVGDLIFPVYLKRIKSNSTTIEFKRSNTTELRYTTRQFRDILNPFSDANRDDRSFYEEYSDFQWKKLDEIIVKNNFGELITSFSLNYTNDSNTRLKLLSVKQNGKYGANEKTHTFSYNTNKMPPYCAEKTDHWGYYNNKTSSNITNYFNSRQPADNVNYYKAETLEKITYPTGGYTTFEYEQNDCRAIVNENRQRLDYQSRNIQSGGLRIKKIESYPIDSSPIIKEYFYVKNYTSRSVIGGLPSSGIQNSHHKYFWKTYLLHQYGRNYYVEKGSSVSSYPYSLNHLGSPVGYSEVVEITNRNRGSNWNGYKIYKYTNYEKYKDDLPISTTDYQLTPYRSFSSNNMQRGKISSIQEFSLTGNKVKEENYYYEKSSNNYVRSLDVLAEAICGPIDGNLLFDFIGVAYKRYIYNFNLIKKETKNYDINGKNEIVEIESYKYNKEKLISEEKMWDSQGNVNTVTYQYPSDYPSGTGIDPSIFDDLIKRGKINTLIKKQRRYNSKIISTEVTKYGLPSKLADTYNKFYDPMSFSISKGNNTLEEKVIYHNYDTKGNIQEVSNEEGIHTVYIWGYNQTLPIAKIEGAKYKNVSTHIEWLQKWSNEDNDRTTGNAGNEGKLRTELQKLRDFFPGFMVTTYTHDPAIGMTSITDPRGETTYYEYDHFNRLEFVKDHNNNMLNAYKYNYKN